MLSEFESCMYLNVYFCSQPDYFNDLCLMFPDVPFDLDGKLSAALPLGDATSCSVGTQCLISGFGTLWVILLLGSVDMYANPVFHLIRFLELGV